MTKNKLLKISTATLSLSLAFVAAFSSFNLRTASAAEFLPIGTETFPDEGFRNYVKQEFDKDKDSRLTQEEIKAAKSIDAYVISSPINDLKGIEYFTELETYSNNNEESKVQSLDFSNLKKLNKVEAKSGNIKSVNLSGCENLLELDLDNNKDLDKVELTGCKNLKKISMINSGVGTLNLADASMLEDVELSGSPKLTGVNFGVHSNLKKLNLKDAPVGNISVKNMPALEVLNMSNTRADKIDISGNPKLDSLDLSYNNIAELDISKNPLLRFLIASENKLNKFTSKENSNLNLMDLSENELTGVDISKFPNLEFLGAGQNRIVSVDASQNQKLKRWEFWTDKVTAKVDTEGVLDMKSVDAQFDMSKVSNWANAERIAGTTKIKVNKDAKDISFSYKSNIQGLDDARNKLNIKRSEDEQEAYTKRIAGANRYETSLKVADELKETYRLEKFDTVIVTNGDNYADALSGAYLAKLKKAPLLLVNEHNISETTEYIKKNLEPGKKVYLLGGTAVVPETIRTSLEGNFEIKRLAGADRFETNISILREAGVDKEDLLICSGYGFADSLAASASGKPILLVGESLSYEQIGYLSSIKTRDYIVIGGKVSVKETVERKLKELGKTERVFGANRYETSVEIANKFFKKPKLVVSAYGDNFPDGLCGGVLAEALGAPLLLVNDLSTEDAGKYTKDNNIKRQIILGGKANISDLAAGKILNK